MRIDHQVGLFDAADLAAESASGWGFGRDVDAESDWHMVFVGARRGSVYNSRPITSRRTGPTARRRNRCTSTSGSKTSLAHERVMALGARVLKDAEGGDLVGQLPGLCRPGRASVLPVLDRAVAGRHAQATSTNLVADEGPVIPG